MPGLRGGLINGPLGQPHGHFNAGSMNISISGLALWPLRYLLTQDSVKIYVYIKSDVGTRYGTSPVIDLQDFVLRIYFFFKIMNLVVKQELENELKLLSVNTLLI